MMVVIVGSVFRRALRAAVNQTLQRPTRAVNNYSRAIRLGRAFSSERRET
jgi:hypothetical protein